MFTIVKRLCVFCVLVITMHSVSLHAQTQPVSVPTWQELLAKADSLNNIAQYDSALVLGKKALEMTEREYGTEDTSVARALNSTGSTYYNQGKYPEAEAAYKPALAIREKVLGPDHLDVAKSLNNLATLYDEQGRYADAEPLFRRALHIREKALGLEHPAVASTVGNLALLYYRQCRYADAEPLHRRALQIREKALGSEHPLVAVSLNNLAVLYYDQGRYAEAEPLHMRALQIREKALGANHPDVALSLNNIAALYVCKGRYADAEPLRQRALQIQEKVLGVEHPDVATSLNNLAGLYYLQGRYADAEPLYRRALQIREKSLGVEHPDVAVSLNDLAVLYKDQGRYVEAEPLHRRALQIREKALGVEHPDVAVSLNSLAELYADQGRYADAEPLFRRALHVWEKALGAEYPDLAYSLDGLANLYSNQKRYVDAEPLYRRALAIRERTIGPEHPLVATSLADIALNAMKRGQFSEAKTAESRAWNIRRKNFHEGAAVLAERNALEYSQFLERESANYLSILLDAPDGQTKNVREIADVIVSSKSQISDGILTRNRSLVSESDSTAIKLSDTLRYARFTLSRLYVDGLGDDSVQVYRHKLNNATKEKERLEANLARRSASFAKEEELWMADAPKVAAELPAGSVLVEFMRHNHRKGTKETDVEPRYLALVISRGGAVSVFPLGAASAMDSAVTTYRDYFQHPELMDVEGYARVSSPLYQRVWRPFASDLEGANTVFIAPDGDLNLVSFAGLTDENGKFLTEKYPLHYLSTGRDLIRLQDSTPSGSGLLAMGDPDFDMSYGTSTAAAIGTAILAGLNLRSSCEALNKLNVSRLPNTRIEVESVAANWKSTGAAATTYFGSDATEESFKQDAPGKKVIHLATHGFFMSEECQKMLNTRSSFGMQEGGYVGENPLLLSGLLLAGANKHGEGAKEAQREDGIVTAEEVAGMNLRGTDLVVLSACETGLGTVKSGEGVYGLRRAFQMAGARTVISALWPIDDKATSELMSQLFTGQGSDDLPQVMQHMQVNRIAASRIQGRWPNPLLWAAFVATGDWKMH